MKKLYFLFIVLMLLLGNNAYAVIMPVDSLQMQTSTPINIQIKQKKLPFFKRLILKSFIKKINKQTNEKKTLNIVGLIGFLSVVFSIVLFLVVTEVAVLWLLLIGILLSIISLGLNKGKRNIFGILGVILGGLGILILYLALRNFGGG